MKIGIGWAVLLLGVSAGSAPGAFEPKCTVPAAAALGGSLSFPLRTGWERGSSLDVAYSPGLFSLPELSLIRCVLARRWEGGEGSLGFSRFGSSMYGETELTLSGALSVASGSSRASRSWIGASLSLCRVEISGYGDAAALALSIDGEVTPSEGLTLRFLLRNAIRGRVGGEDLPACQVAAMNWNPDPALLLTLEMRVETDQPMAFSCGMAWRPIARFTLRCGTSSDHPGIDGGGGVEIGGIRFDYAMRWHRELGATHAISLGFEDLF